jgi:hypothetical protein
MKTKNIPSYKPLRRCLYCGCFPPPDVLLTDEHILALSLGGYPILPESSCTDCQRITHDFETVVSRELLLNARTHLRVRTRNPQKRPKELPTTIGDVPLIRHPMFLALQEFNHPEILGLPPVFPPDDKSSGTTNLPFRMHTAPDTAKRHNALGAVGTVGVPLRFNARALQLTLAKTAHAYAVAELGAGIFRPLLPDMILGRMLNLDWLIGAIPHANADVPSGRDKMPPLFHLIELRRARTSLGGTLLSCEITLFKPLGMPVYQVIVGSLTKAINSVDPLRSFTQHL